VLKRLASLRVVKVGGNELDQAGWLDAWARDVARTGPAVVVHGGGRAISALSDRLGLPVAQRDGLRITTPEVADVVEMVLAGPVSRAIVAALGRAGALAVGLSGIDGGLFTAERFDPALGQVGRITTVRPDVLAALLAAGFTPVVAPMAPVATGEILNVNADDAAAALAAALQASELLFISDVSGVLVDGAASQALSVDEVEPLIARGAADGGMAAKLRAAASARSAGVASVRLGSLDMLRDASAGTRLVAAPLTPTLVP